MSNLKNYFTHALEKKLVLNFLSGDTLEVNFLFVMVFLFHQN